MVLFCGRSEKGRRKNTSVIIGGFPDFRRTNSSVRITGSFGAFYAETLLMVLWCVFPAFFPFLRPVIFFCFVWKKSADAVKWYINDAKNLILCLEFSSVVLICFELTSGADVIIIECRCCWNYVELFKIIDVRTDIPSLTRFCFNMVSVLSTLCSTEMRKVEAITNKYQSVNFNKKCCLLKSIFVVKVFFYFLLLFRVFFQNLIYH